MSFWMRSIKVRFAGCLIFEAAMAGVTVKMAFGLVFMASLFSHRRDGKRTRGVAIDLGRYLRRVQNFGAHRSWLCFHRCWVEHLLLFSACENVHPANVCRFMDCRPCRIFFMWPRTTIRCFIVARVAPSIDLRVLVVPLHARSFFILETGQSVRCLKCNEKGHMANNCPNLIPKEPPQ